MSNIGIALRPPVQGELNRHPVRRANVPNPMQFNKICVLSFRQSPKGLQVLTKRAGGLGISLAIGGRVANRGCKCLRYFLATVTLREGPERSFLKMGLRIMEP